MVWVTLCILKRISKRPTVQSILFQKSLEIREKIERDSRDLMIASAWTNIVLVLEDMLEDPEESLLYLKKALLLRERKLGRNSIPTSDSHTYIGNVQMLLGDFPSAHDSR